MTSMREELMESIGRECIAIVWSKERPYKARYGFSCVICKKNIPFVDSKHSNEQIHNHVRRRTAAELRAWWICKVMADPVPDIPF